MPDFNRRSVISAVSGLGLVGLLSGDALASQAQARGAPTDVYRIDDEATILAAARAIIAEDTIAALITVDSAGFPRARSISVEAAPIEADLTMWLPTRRTSRKVTQLRNNPTATLYFNHDGVNGDFSKSYYATFMGSASVHTDAATLAAMPLDEKVRKSSWPNYPEDFAIIRFKPRWLEVYGRGIKGRKDNWQPQGIVLPG